MKKTILLIFVFVCVYVQQIYAIDITDNKIIKNIELKSTPGYPDKGFGRIYSNGHWKTARYMDSTNEGMVLSTEYFPKEGGYAAFSLSILRDPILRSSTSIKINSTEYYINFQLLAPFRFFSHTEPTSLYYSFDNRNFTKALVDTADVVYNTIGVYFNVKNFNEFYNGLKGNSFIYFKIKNKRGTSVYSYPLDGFSYIYDFSLFQLKNPY